MKNINILPTDKPSRLYLFEERLILGDLVTVVFKKSGAVNQYIYITSNEEIKFNDYVTDGYLVWQWKDNSSLLGRKKIILTTDQDLIKDGVHAIDDEFLEWFVQNSSCEEVEVKHYNNQCSGECGICDNTCGDWHKIIIPKEEPKQECGYCKQPISKYGCACGKQIEEPKQETLEEVAVIYAHKSFIWPLNKQGEKQSIPPGQIVPPGYAKHQKLATKHFTNGAKWQQERSYSEEEVIKLLIYCKDRFGGSGLEDYTHDDEVKEWFEQFKKK
jgi:hypothetical protein